VQSYDLFDSKIKITLSRGFESGGNRGQRRADAGSAKSGTMEVTNLGQPVGLDTCGPRIATPAEAGN